MNPSSSSQVEPARYGGWGKVASLVSAGLTGVFFNSQCPPIITPDTIIVAACGPNDYVGNAAPKHDGWIFSDFFLYHHLFRHTAKEQYWITCVSPETLVEKYKEYAHGSPAASDRRIVLDRSMLEEVYDVLVFQPKSLLDRFLSYVANASKGIRGTTRPLLIAIFGHGTKEVYSITIGGARHYSKCPELTRDKFRKVIKRHNPDPNIALLASSCFGGGWVQSSFANITATAGVNADDELLSLPGSRSIQRYYGSRYATGVVQALIKTSFKDVDLRKGGEDEEAIESSPTYAELVKTIHETLATEVDVRENNMITFSAKDDVWDMEWRARTGFPLTSYEAKWKALRPVPAGDASEVSMRGPVRCSDFITVSTPQAEFRLKRLAFDYVNSYPGNSSAAKNHFTAACCTQLLEGKQLPNELLEALAAALRYRMELMKRATEFKDRLQLIYPDCTQCDVEKIYLKAYKDPAKRLRQSQIYDLVIPRHLFDEPADHEGHPYSKGNRYLIALLMDSDCSLDLIERQLDELVKLKSQTSKYDLVAQSLRKTGDRSIRGMLEMIAKGSKKRLRSMSPVKHERRSLEGVFGH